MIAHEADHLVASLLQLGNEIREDPMHADDHGAVAAFEAGVLRGITGMPAPRQRRRRRIARHVATVAAAAVLAIVPGPRTAIAHWFGIGSVRIERDTTREVTGPPFSVLDLDLGTPSTLAHAQARLGRTVATISGHVPAGVWIQPFGPAGSDSVIVNSVYATGPLKDVFGAAGGTDDAVLVSQLAGSGDVYINKKLLGQGTQMEFLTIRGERAVWLRGDPHEVLMRDAHGTIDVVPVRLAGSVLLWADSTRTIRIEGLSERSAAIAVLERIVPR